MKCFKNIIATLIALTYEPQILSLLLRYSDKIPRESRYLINNIFYSFATNTIQNVTKFVVLIL
jgi:hypothetical protein